MESNYLFKLKDIYRNMCQFNDEKIPLCAAETFISDFVRQGLSSIYEGKYIQGYKHRDILSDNIGSDRILPIMNLVEEICQEQYRSNYVDSRTLSGMNCIALSISAVVGKEKPVIITEKNMGGHASLPPILDNLGISYVGLPYDYDKNEINYTELNSMLLSKEYSFIIFCQSDIIKQPQYESIVLPENVGLIYDASQTLGLIGAGLLSNPLDYFYNSLLIGGTHKTIPGPTCGLIMTNNISYMDKIDSTISPTLLRNVQPNNIFSLCLALIEQIEVGKDYQSNIVETANKLGHYLDDEGIDVVRADDVRYTETHQLFLRCPNDKLDRIFIRALNHNVTLNKKKMSLFTGIRLGVQEIARYRYSEDDLKIAARIIRLIFDDDNNNDNEIRIACQQLAKKKKPYYILDDIFV